ncbi:restriction endonuclease subunit S [Prevotella sp. lc2012]|uniref:restriction endonuclease subunit S n=1 Tax=Prevotella sp. lc2012 TaxID=1761886 RepID=UPI000895421D|nr:restriction endonuclease subunit S [Prevotella sp. lc2012]SEE42783.1 type I restriction enzyme, S subunit [Prevotella sp. lc2012]
MDKHIPQGYKESPLGIIPEGWEVKRLGDLCLDIYSGRNKTRIDSGTYPVYGSTGIIGKTNEYQYEGEKVLVARVGAHAGQVGLASGKYDVSDNTIIVENKDYYSLYFAYQQLIAANLNKMVFGSGQPLITAGMLKRMFVIYPPYEEQELINSVLKLWDTAIEKQSELIEKLKLRKRALMQQLLTGKKRLPGFSEEWKVQRIKDHFMQIEDRNDGKGHIPMTISAKYGLVSQKDKFDRVVAGNSLEKYTLLRKGDFAYNKGNSNLYEMGCIYRLKEESAVVPFVYICFRTKDNTCSEFYKHFFINHGLDSQLKRIITSGARGDGLLNVNSEDFMSLKMPYPIIEEQEAIANVLNSADKEIELAEKKLANLLSQKRGLMQQLLTGKKRINKN